MPSTKQVASRLSNKPVALLPEESAFCLKRIFDQHSLSSNALRMVHKQELDKSKEVHEEFQPAPNTRFNM
jgi:hypothetical protein